MDTMQQTVADVKLSLTATGNHLAFLQNFGNPDFRAGLKGTDEEIERHISSQNMNIMVMTREHLLMYRWLKETGRLPMYEEYRSRVQDMLREDQG